MLARFQTVLELLYPPRCVGCGAMVDSDFGLCGSCWRATPFIGGTVCDACGTPLPGSADGTRLECDDCIKMPRPWRQGRSAVLYKDRARHLILAFKHGDRPEIARPAAAWMASAARSLVGQNSLIVPVPLHWSRFLKRRYNQSALLAEALGRSTGTAYCPDLLTRCKRTTTLDGKRLQDRFAELSGAIRISAKRRHLIAGRPVLIVDDVMTSGATLHACTHACLEAGAKDVCILALARVAKED